MIQETHTPITVANSRAFNDGADFGDMRNPAVLGSERISMAPTGRSLSDLLAGFDQPAPPPVAPGSFVRNIEAEANKWGQEFGERITSYEQVARSYWAAPVVTVPPVRPAAPTALDRVGSFADGLANAFTGSAAAPPQPGVETDGLSTSQRSLSGNFGQLAQSGEPSAYERRYQQPPRKPGNDYV